MKTLVFYGSARQKGHTKELLDCLVEKLEGEVEIIDAYRTEVAPCKDCRYCWHKKGCSIKDTMQDIYQKIEECDNVVFAAPMYFHSIPGPMKTLIDRLQVYWACAVRKDRPEVNVRKGGVLMVGGAPGFEQQFKAGEILFNGLLHDLSADGLGTVCMENTDVDSLADRVDVQEQIAQLAEKLNAQSKSVACE